MYNIYKMSHKEEKEALLPVRDVIEKQTIIEKFMLLTVFVSSRMVSGDIVEERNQLKIHSIDTFCNVKHGDTLDKEFCLYDFPSLFELMYRTSNLHLLHSYKVERMLTNMTKN